MAFFKAGAFGLLTTSIAGNAEHAGTEDTEIRKLLELRHADVQSLAAAHGESRHRAMLTIGVNAIILFNMWNDIVEEIIGEFVDSWTRAARSKRARVAGGHHHQHRFRFFCGDEIIHDEPGAADAGPGIVRVRSAMK